MASISNDKSNGRRIIQFKASDGRRRSIRLGKVSKKQAEAVKLKVEDLVGSSITGHPPSNETSRWLNNIDTDLYGKLANVGLVQAREGTKLGKFVDGYIASRHDVKPATITTYIRTKNKLVGFFGNDRDLRTITPGDADDWFLWMLEHIADNTARKYAGNARLFTKSAFRKGLVDINPFDDLPGGCKANRERDYFISRDEADSVLQACPDAQWRCLFALARYGGMRNPSETLNLKWSDIDWENSRFTVKAPKTEHHEGKETRVVPLFPELQPYLQDCFELAEDGDEYVITRYREQSSNTRTQFKRIIERAGLKPWDKPWQNLRSTRETELAEVYPTHVVCAWIGNSARVAAKHYLQVTDDHFDRATKAVQNPVQHPAAHGGNESHQKKKNCTEPHEDAMQCSVVGDTGLEPVTSRV